MAEHWVKIGGMADALRGANIPGQFEVQPELRERLAQICPNGKVHVQNCPYDTSASSNYQVGAYVVFDNKDAAIRWRLLYGGEYFYVEEDKLVDDFSYSVRMREDLAEYWKNEIMIWMQRGMQTEDWRYIYEEGGDYLFQFRHLKDAVHFRQAFTRL
jgi:hypothetical protein